jgi:predicted transcriptional regulator
MLDALGVRQPAEDVYRALLKHGPTTLERLAAAAGVDATVAAAALDELRTLGLAASEGDRGVCWHAESPEITLASLVVREQEDLLERQRDLDRAQSAVGELLRVSRSRGPGPGIGAVELTTDPQAIRRRCGHLARTTERSVLSFDRPACPGSPAEADADEELALLARGVEIQAVYERPVLLAPGRFEALRRLVAAGEQARTLPALPMRLVVFDRANAVVHLDDREGTAPAALFVHPCELLSGLVTLFELLWDRAVPVPAAPEDVEGTAAAQTGFDDVLLALLAAGFKDESIARHLGISASTVTRRMARLMDQTGTSTRFQLGMQAVRRGWI